MQISVYVIYELLIRLQELNPDVGEYITNKKTDSGIVVHTSTGNITILNGILIRQFNDPASITQDEILNLLKNFKLNSSA